MEAIKKKIKELELKSLMKRFEIEEEPEVSFACRIIEDMNDWIKIDGGDPIQVWKGKEIVHFGKGLKKHL